MSLPIFVSALLLTGAQTDPDPIPANGPTASILAPIAGDQVSAESPQSILDPSIPPPVPSPPPSSIPPEVTDTQASPGLTEEGEIIVTGRPRMAGDPLEGINAASFAVTQAIDDAVVAPASMTFKRIVPTPIRAGISNFVYNINEIDIFLNFMLQHKIGKAVETVGRFVLNSTLGGFGLFDVAKRHPFRLPRRNNGFADTMGFYGVGSGPYLFLPIIGASTVRDLIGRNLDRLVVPLAIGKPFNQSAYTIPMNVAVTLDTRSQFDDELKKVRASSDPYAARRTYYLRSRQAEIDHLRGKDRVKPDAAAPPPVTPQP